MSRLKITRGQNRFWSGLHRMGMARARLPFWRVVVEAKLDHRARAWPIHFGGAVTGVFVWARTVEEAEGLAALALHDEGMEAVTADAVRISPAARPSLTPKAVARTPFGFLPRLDEETRGYVSRRGASL
jgi:hypothetical protein